jgi:hypothetical protein
LDGGRTARIAEPLATSKVLFVVLGRAEFLFIAAPRFFFLPNPTMGFGS